MRKLLVGFLLASALVVSGATSAQAHTELTQSNPADGSSVAAPLDRIELVFSEPPLIDGSKISLADASGADIAVDDTQLDGSTLFIPWPSELTPGDITINWRVVADDGHVEDGSLSFTYTASATSSLAPETPEPEVSMSAVATPTTVDDPMVGATPLALLGTSASDKPRNWLPIGLGLGVLIGGAWAMTRKKSDKS